MYPLPISSPTENGSRFATVSVSELPKDSKCCICHDLFVRSTPPLPVVSHENSHHPIHFECLLRMTLNDPRCPECREEITFIDGLDIGSISAERKKLIEDNKKLMMNRIILLEDHIHLTRELNQTRSKLKTLTASVGIIAAACILWKIHQKKIRHNLTLHGI